MAPRLLVVAHLEALGQSIGRRGRDAGWSTTVAATVADALVAMDGESFDAVVADYHFPDGGLGTEVVRRAVELGARAVVMCGGIAPAEADAASAAGASAILHKPFAIEALFAHLADRADGAI